MDITVIFNKWLSNIMTICYELFSVPIEHTECSLSSAVAAFLDTPQNAECCFEILTVCESDLNSVMGVKRRTFLFLHMVADKNKLNLLLNKASRLKALLAQDDYILRELEKDVFEHVCTKVMSAPFKASSFPKKPTQMLSGFIDNSSQHLPEGTAYSLMVVKSKQGRGFIANGMIVANNRQLLTTAANPLPLWGLWDVVNKNKNYILFRMDLLARRNRKQDVVLSEKEIYRLLALPSGRSTAFKCSAPKSNVTDIPPRLQDKVGGVKVGDLNFPNGQKQPLYLHERDFSTHTCLVGKSGSGKTSLLENIMTGCHKVGINLLCLDVEGTDLRNIAPSINADVFTFNSNTSPYFINPFRIAGLGDKETADILKDVFTACLDVESPLDIFLKDTLDEMYAKPYYSELRSMKEFRSLFQETFKQNKYSCEVSDNLFTATDARLRDLSFLGGGNSVFNTRDILENSSIFELQAVNYARDRLFIMGFILSTIFRIKKKDHEMGRNSKPLIVVLDEAHVVLRRKDHKTSEYFVDLVERIIREGRKYGMWLIVSDQDPCLMKEFIQHVGMKIIMRSEMETNMLAKTLRTTAAEEYLPILQTGEAYLRVGDMDGALFISSPVPLECVKMSNDDVKEYMLRRGRLHDMHEVPHDVQIKVKMLGDKIVDWILKTLLKEGEIDLKKIFSLKILARNLFPDDEQLLPQVADYLADRFNQMSYMSFIWETK